MFVEQVFPKKVWFSRPMLYLLMMILGIAVGLSDIQLLKQLGMTISDIFVKLFQCISLPVIALSIIVTLANYTSDGGMKTIWQRTIRFTLITTIIAATISCILYLLIQPDLVSNISSLHKIPLQSTSYFHYLNDIIPSNILAPFLDHQVMGVLLLSLVVGFAIRYIPDQDSRAVITQFFKGIHGLFLVMTRWIIIIIPIGLFGFITTTVVQLRSGMDIKGISEYLLIILMANVVQGFVVLPLWLKMHGIRPFQAMKAMMPALSVAFFSKSSVGTLPITMDTIEKNLSVKPEISRFVLPLCTSINMNGCAAFIFTTVIYLMQNNGITITLPMMALWIVIATIAAIGNAGVPMGCFFLSASLLVSMQVPITLLGLILPFYTLIDMFETALNVWSDACVTKVVNDGLLIESPSYKTENSSLGAVD